MLWKEYMPLIRFDWYCEMYVSKRTSFISDKTILSEMIDMVGIRLTFKWRSVYHFGLSTSKRIPLALGDRDQKFETNKQKDIKKVD